MALIHPPRVYTVPLDGQQLDMLIEAIDSHVYWQLSDDTYRNDGDVIEPGSDEPAQAEDIVRFRALSEKLQALRP